MKQLHTIHLPKLSGKKTLARADDILSYIDPDFEKWNTDKVGEKTEEMDLAVCELEKDSTFKEIFTKPEEMALSQAQIIQFCRDHKDKLRQYGYGTFFLFKVGTDFFVARVGVRSVGLDVDVHRFSDDDVWYADFRPRIVVPQLAVDPLIPCPLDITEIKVVIGGKEVVFVRKE